MSEESNSFLPDIKVDERYCESTSNSQQSEITNETSRNVLPEKCEVCGNPAVGYHYDVATCNGCKAFFRRTVITGRRVICRRRKNCLVEMEPKNRRICPGCRFSKCEEVGMNPRAIRAEISSGGKILKDELIAKREPRSKIMLSPKSKENEVSRLISDLNLIENQIDELFNSSLPINYGDWRTLSEIIQMKPYLKVSKIPNLKLIRNQMNAELAGYAHNGSLAMVEYAKMLDFFPKISKETAIKLVKHGLFMCGSLSFSRRSIQKYNSDILRFTDGSVAGKPKTNWNGVMLDHRRIAQKTLHSILRVKLDYVEYLFLKAITMCNPDLIMHKAFSIIV
ncbi:Nuclear receptor [Caenorhabditis elegans]|uniref:Nuclear receptor n=1 Tax=Caenorhabditis elegans TaxID=6239 RepID=N1NTC6_CAEEL|nr:Nuclear receptor [Caenorhabditis elegans]CCW45962.1 Nuclear receptor [Caenorhabditis elegans]|eukprot:NP_001294679.1 Nuclear Hormone Receptor family [Caenorhabditis elegans]